MDPAKRWRRVTAGAPQVPPGSTPAIRLVARQPGPARYGSLSRPATPGAQPAGLLGGEAHRRNHAPRRVGLEIGATGILPLRACQNTSGQRPPRPCRSGGTHSSSQRFQGKACAGARGAGYKPSSATVQSAVAGATSPVEAAPHCNSVASSNPKQRTTGFIARRPRHCAVQARRGRHSPWRRSRRTGSTRDLYFGRRRRYSFCPDLAGQKACSSVSATVPARSQLPSCLIPFGSRASATAVNCTATSLRARASHAASDAPIKPAARCSARQANVALLHLRLQIILHAHLGDQANLSLKPVDVLFLGFEDFLE